LFVLTGPNCWARSIRTGGRRVPEGELHLVQTSDRSFPPSETGRQGNHRSVLRLPCHTQVIVTGTGIRWIREKSPERTNWIRLLASPGNQTIVFDPQKVIAILWGTSLFGKIHREARIALQSHMNCAYPGVQSAVSAVVCLSFTS
jgi:hypothetical protein